MAQSPEATAELPTLPSWKDVLNSRHLPNMFTDRTTFFKSVVIPSGYPYFMWGDRLYQVTGDSFIDTGYIISDII